MGWFAYQANYSHGGYVYVDASRVRHMFICMVSKENVVIDNPTMRVVGQDRAYPFWLVSYTLGESSSFVGVTALSGIAAYYPTVQRSLYPAHAATAASFSDANQGQWVAVADNKKSNELMSNELTWWKYQASRGRV